MKTFVDLRYGTHERNFLNLYLPDEGCSDLIIWFHGGGLEEGSRIDLLFHEDLVKQGIGVASVEYRLYPEAQFPDFIVDCANAVRYVMDHITQYADPMRIFVTGQSAGAYITLMLAFDEHYLKTAGVDCDAIAGFVSDSAQITTHFNVLRERGVDPRLERIDEAAPIFHLHPGSWVKDLLLIHYTEDLPCRPEENILFYESIRRLCPNICVKQVCLPGKHCNGSLARNERGTFDFIEVLLDHLKER